MKFVDDKVIRNLTTPCTSYTCTNTMDYKLLDGARITYKNSVYHIQKIIRTIDSKWDVCIIDYIPHDDDYHLPDEKFMSRCVIIPNNQGLIEPFEIKGFSFFNIYVAVNNIILCENYTSIYAIDYTKIGPNMSVGNGLYYVGPANFYNNGIRHNISLLNEKYFIMYKNGVSVFDIETKKHCFIEDIPEGIIFEKCKSSKNDLHLKSKCGKYRLIFTIDILNNELSYLRINISMPYITTTMHKINLGSDV